MKSSLLLFMSATFLSLAACDSLFDVENPNQLTENDVVDPTAAEALVNGALSTTARANGQIMAIHSTASDELDFHGSRDGWMRLAEGHVDDPFNEFTDAAFPFVAEARWMSDRAIEQLETFDAEGTLNDQANLGRAYLWGAVAYTIVADYFEDFAFSDRTEEAPPIGSENMDEVYGQAINYLDNAVSIARTTETPTLERRALAVRARAKFARQIWQKLNPPGSVPTDPLANSTEAASDASEVLDLLAEEPDWKFQFNYSSATISNDMAEWVNERSEMEVGSEYAILNDAGNAVASIILNDPIDDIPAPSLVETVNEFEAARGFAPLTITSAREMHLILAETALAQEDVDGFTSHVNQVRGLDGLTPFSGQVDALELLKHERRVNLFFQGRRLADQYRFDEPSETWQSSSAANQQPGTMFPITAVENRSNCYILGTC